MAVGSGVGLEGPKELVHDADAEVVEEGGDAVGCECGCVASACGRRGDDVGEGVGVERVLADHCVEHEGGVEDGAAHGSGCVLWDQER